MFFSLRLIQKSSNTTDLNLIKYKTYSVNELSMLLQRLFLQYVHTGEERWILQGHIINLKIVVLLRQAIHMVKSSAFLASSEIKKLRNVSRMYNNHSDKTYINQIFILKLLCKQNRGVGVHIQSKHFPPLFRISYDKLSK